MWSSGLEIGHREEAEADRNKLSVKEFYHLLWLRVLKLLQNPPTEEGLQIRICFGGGLKIPMYTFNH